MINHFFGGDLTQDRIGYEVHKDDSSGPETDLNYDEGNWPDDPLGYALGVRVPRVGRAGGFPGLWSDIVAAIDAGRPTLIVIAQPGGGTHSIVIHGYEIDRRVNPPRFSYIVNDPGNHGSSSAIRGPMEYWGVANRFTLYYIVPPGAAGVRQEATIGIDTESDKVYDFDEEKRFNTGLNDPDTDDDCADDYAEISLSVLDPGHGFGTWTNASGSDGAARQYARRGRPAPELTNDSDGGGLPDFVEDLNLDGKIDRDQGESDPHDPTDDPRKIIGTKLRTRDRDDPPSHTIQTLKVEYDLQTGSEGKVTGTARITYNSRKTFQADAAPPQCPAPREITWQFNEVRGEVEVEGEFVCYGDKGPAIYLRDKGEPLRASAIGIQYDPCSGNGPTFESELVHSGGQQFVPEVGDAFGVISDAFFPTKDHVQWKTRHQYSTLATERNFIMEWDLVMTPK